MLSPQSFRQLLHAPTLAWFWQPFQGLTGAWSQLMWVALASSFAGLMVPLFSMAVYDRVLPIGATRTLWLFTLGIVLVLAVDALLRLLRSHGLASILAQVAQKQDDALMDILLRQRTGGTIWGQQAQAMQQAHELREQLIMHVLPTLADLPFIAIFLVFIGVMAPTLLPVPIVLLILAVGLQLALLPHLTGIAGRQTGANQQRTRAVYELLRSALATRLTNRHTQATSRWAQLTHGLHGAEGQGQAWQQLGQHITLILSQFGFVMVLVMGAQLVITNQLTAGALVAASMLCARVMAPALHVVDALMRVAKIRAQLAQLSAQLAYPLEDTQPTPTAPETLPTCRGDLKLQQVSLTLPGTQRPLLNGINLHIQAAERWGIAGTNGAGKSTLLGLLAGLHLPNAGTYALDDILTHRLPPTQLRNHIALVPQTLIFPDLTLQQVICGTATPNQEHLAQALHVSGLGQVMAELGIGLAFQAGPDAERFSGGQRQMLAIATAIYQQPRVLLLDEPTSAMAPEVEEQLHQRLAQWLSQHRTTLLLVTHRTTALQLVDNLVIMAHGSILFGGAKKDVLKRLQGPKAA